MVATYNWPTDDPPGHTPGGYSQRIVVHERYVRRIAGRCSRLVGRQRLFE